MAVSVGYFLSRFFEAGELLVRFFNFAEGCESYCPAVPLHRLVHDIILSAFDFLIQNFLPFSKPYQHVEIRKHKKLQFFAHDRDQFLGENLIVDDFAVLLSSLIISDEHR